MSLVTGYQSLQVLLSPAVKSLRRAAESFVQRMSAQHVRPLLLLKQPLQRPPQRLQHATLTQSFGDTASLHPRWSCHLQILLAVDCMLIESKSTIWSSRTVMTEHCSSAKQRRLCILRLPMWHWIWCVPLHHMPL